MSATLNNESSVVWDSDFKTVLFHTTYSGVFRRVLKRLEPTLDFVQILADQQNSLQKSEAYVNSLKLETGIKLRLSNRSYSIYNIPKELTRNPENAFKIRRKSGDEVKESQA